MGVAGTLIIPVSCITSDAAFFPLSRLALLNKGSFSNACLITPAVQMLLLLLLLVKRNVTVPPLLPQGLAGESCWQRPQRDAGYGPSSTLLLSGWAEGAGRALLSPDGSCASAGR